MIGPLVLRRRLTTDTCQANVSVVSDTEPSDRTSLAWTDRNVFAQKVLRNAFRFKLPVHCFYCGHEVQRGKRGQNPQWVATVDHLQPVSRGGENSYENAVIACYSCNKLKGALTLEEFLAVRHDSAALARARWVQDQILMGNPSDPELFLLLKAEREAARLDKVMERMVEPDVNCPHCLGTGKFHKKNKSHICRCSVPPKQVAC